MVLFIFTNKEQRAKTYTMLELRPQFTIGSILIILQMMLVS
jgi:hypothetical protein